MKHKTELLVLGILSLLFFSSFSFKTKRFERPSFERLILNDTIKKDSILNDSIKTEANYRFKLYKKGAHASYYHDKFTGRKTASGQIFDNQKYTAAHKKLPFGTKVRVTNEANDKSVMVTINDRGPFTKGREIDLSKRAFRDIARHHGYGTMKVTIEIVEEVKDSLKLD
ncbi:septal ring lytic transglycosylase RlpA family protein [Flavobacterium piscinae]|uniref:Probable endolytic peptidoglycan transglycosylase RlpA n=1 Tax=Flavobacterium piscinae TaxID=2506424 RepID=A0A4V1N4W1_9FLAO|nr:septal ring lytic transglycosylase RlpA family protein [Flavobacterium piscinae]RXR33546.1 septal ring lytic transglycosylase RlpA family protein [Flavobacterium piscinae]